jgi:hypothetical protein
MSTGNLVESPGEPLGHRRFVEQLIQRNTVRDIEFCKQILLIAGERRGILHHLADKEVDMFFRHHPCVGDPRPRAASISNVAAAARNRGHHCVAGGAIRCL